MIKQFIFSAFFLVSINLFAQKGSLKIEFGGQIENDTSTKQYEVVLRILKNDDTIYTQFHDRNTVEIFHLAPGNYSLRISNTDTEALEIERKFTIEAGKQSYIDLDLNIYESKYLSSSPNCDSLHEVEAIKEHFLPEINLIYGNPFSFDPQNPVKNEFTFGMGGGMTYAFWNHLAVGFHIGGNFSHAYFSKDSSLVTLQNRTFERYTYLTMPIGVRLLFSSGNQNNEDSKPGFLIDVGARYYAPILCRHIARYSADKIQHQNIHQFTDLRIHAGIGIYPLEFFAEYRLMDFLLGNYPEMPKLRVGLKILLGDYY